MAVQYSEEQLAAIDALCEGIENPRKKVLVLDGPAGTGKSTIMLLLVGRYNGVRDITLVCPTGKAALVLSRKTGMQATTVHRKLYEFVKTKGGKPDFSGVNKMCGENGIVICDEGFMLSADLLADMMLKLPKGATIVLVGDKEQVPPVSGGEIDKFKRPTARLTHVFRQALESPIIRFATARRQNKRYTDWVDGECEIYKRCPAEWMVDNIDADATLIVVTNALRNELNNQVREMLGYYELVNVGDRLICLSNNYSVELMNGEVVSVISVSENENLSTNLGTLVYTLILSNGKVVYLNAALMGESVGVFGSWHRSIRNRDKRYQKFVHFGYGYAVTVHKAQGSEWDKVMIVLDEVYRSIADRHPKNAKALLYTAITRAKTYLGMSLR